MRLGGELTFEAQHLVSKGQMLGELKQHPAGELGGASEVEMHFFDIAFHL